MNTITAWPDTGSVTVFVLACLIFPSAAHSGEFTDGPTGVLVISRDVPQHGAFRGSDRGVPTVIATAREDLVLSGVGLLTGKQTALSDAALSGISGDRASTNILPKLIGEKIAGDHIGAALSGMSAVPGDGARANESVGGTAANFGAALSKNLTPIGSAIMSAFPGGK